MDMRIELIPVPVTNTDESIAFYVDKLGFNKDIDYQLDEKTRFVQLTPKTSACSILIGEGMTEMKPGTQEIQVVVEDVEKVRDELIKNGVNASDLDKQDWGTFTYIKDPDGNSWTIQQLPPKEELVKWE